MWTESSSGNPKREDFSHKYPILSRMSLLPVLLQRTIPGSSVNFRPMSKKLVICGAGHVSIPVIQIGRMIGCTVTVLEDRPKFAYNARRAGADTVLCEPFEEGLKKIPGDPDIYFIIVTRGHRYDQVCLEKIMKKEHAYIGMMGSRARTVKVKQALLEQGADPQVPGIRTHSHRSAYRRRNSGGDRRLHHS